MRSRRQPGKRNGPDPGLEGPAWEAADRMDSAAARPRLAGGRRPEKAMDASGELTSTFEQKLLDSGTGKSGATALAAMTPKPKQAAPGKAAPKALVSLLFPKAYQSGKIRLSVEVEKGSGGRRLILRARNQTKDPFEMVVPKGPLTIAAGSPVEVLRLVIDKEQRFPLTPNGTSPPFSAGQSGTRGAIEGKFELTVYEGEPLFSGSVKIGSLE